MKITKVRVKVKPILVKRAKASFAKLAQAIMEKPAKAKKRTRFTFKQHTTAKAILTPVARKSRAQVKPESGKHVKHKLQFNFLPPKTPLIQVDAKGKFRKFIFKTRKTVLRLKQSYAFYCRGVKLIGRIVSEDDIGAKFVKMLVWQDVGKVQMKARWFKVARKDISLNPWDTVGEVPREKAPREVLYAHDRMERYKKSGGQKLLKGKKTTPNSVD